MGSEREKYYQNTICVVILRRYTDDEKVSDESIYHGDCFVDVCKRRQQKLLASLICEFYDFSILCPVACLFISFVIETTFSLAEHIFVILIKL